MDLPLLDVVEVRVLGSLIEKELATPDYYPLSLNALTNACNQLSNREPVVTFSETEVSRALDRLRDKQLAFVLSGGENRVTKSGHKTADTLGLARAELAALAVLFLRGQQTTGEIRNRSGRLHDFADLAAAQLTLDALATRPVPLVVRQPRRPGEKESRYAHLLSGAVELPAHDQLIPAVPAPCPPSDASARLSALETELAALKHEMTDLRQQLANFRRQFE